MRSDNKLKFEQPVGEQTKAEPNGEALTSRASVGATASRAAGAASPAAGAASPAPGSDRRSDHGYITAMLFMVIERFRPGQAPEVYRRFRERGRMAPPAVRYIDSWVDLRFERCFQVMEAADESALETWTRHWTDLVDFEIVAVRTSAEAAALMNHP
jgi:hypothetical protein